MIVLLHGNMAGRRENNNIKQLLERITAYNIGLEKEFNANWQMSHILFSFKGIPMSVSSIE